MYIAQHVPGAEDQAREALSQCTLPDAIIALTAHRFRRNLYFYYECDGEPIAPEAIFPGLVAHLEPIPCRDEPRHFAQMIDIFHYQVPGERAAWRTGEAGEPWVRIAMIKPDMLASYIFYHWQLQEERPGDGPKYGVIAVHENMLYFYMERPFTAEPATYPGKLTTSNTPGGWGELMNPHFIPWPDTTPDQALFRDDLEPLLDAR